ncbi:carbon monoxide dehydrogenase subunit G [Rhizobium sp. P32RR-XVIII]|uniref:SRPBCC family protein n=1 Tax=Rhizobium sp. P32RR-XVIII TaxID=2726738 RepID=UPI001456B4C3|nr:carbon monoxide dehydrogenase subunit G [Rhizobium sp. P32RR-XVIII]NLS03965.1 carbon monoxide dehydrogenase subunit G [Rhizobium sp. P32RR-XVIII]
MDLKGEYRIKASRENVWKMINDPEVLKACLPGCESLQGSPAEGFIARVTTKIGPIKATFEGAVKLSNIEAPASYTISGEGKGGVAGFAKGGADVKLAEDGNETILTYVANAQVGGKLAQLGARLIDSTAKKLADEFFKSLADRISEPLAAPVPPVAPSVASVAAAPSPRPASAASAASAAASPAMNPAKLWIIVAAAVAVVVIAAAVLR